MRHYLLVAGALMLPGEALAADPTTPTNPTASEMRLTPEQVEKVLDDAAKKREVARPPQIEGLQEDKLPAPIHGEVGVTIGSGGYRSAYLGANVALSDDGFASFYFEEQTGRDPFPTWERR